MKTIFTRVLISKCPSSIVIRRSAAIRNASLNMRDKCIYLKVRLSSLHRHLTGLLNSVIRVNVLYLYNVSRYLRYKILMMIRRHPVSIRIVRYSRNRRVLGRYSYLREMNNIRLLRYKRITHNRVSNLRAIMTRSNSKISDINDDYQRNCTVANRRYNSSGTNRSCHRYLRAIDRTSASLVTARYYTPSDVLQVIVILYTVSSLPIVTAGKVPLTLTCTVYFFVFATSK